VSTSDVLIVALGVYIILGLVSAYVLRVNKGISILMFILAVLSGPLTLLLYYLYLKSRELPSIGRRFEPKRKFFKN